VTDSCAELSTVVAQAFAEEEEEGGGEIIFYTVYVLKPQVEH